ncbi:30S ribosomal protein S9 [Candidatus Parcubacteria bacterium]|jgi:small subunit ribosomal protein S9|nr:MAG: 30S ribosomal protein S9 [Candidatus Parcubacteria bacterium]
MPVKPAKTFKKRTTHQASTPSRAGSAASGKSASKKSPAKKISAKKPKAEKAPGLRPSLEIPKAEVQNLPPQEKYLISVGKRKTAIARVRYYALGSGEIQVNNLTLDKYFNYQPWIDQARSPLQLTGWQKGRWSIKVQGGGKPAQAHAISHGLARLLVQLDETLKPALRAAGMLTRDARVKERKKYGLKRARRAPQWQKR